MKHLNLLIGISKEREREKERERDLNKRKMIYVSGWVRICDNYIEFG